jgi:cytochrome c peroxidase
MMRKQMMTILFLGTLLASLPAAASDSGDRRDARLVQLLQAAGFTGRIESTLEPRLGRKLNPKLAQLGRDIFFDTITGLHDDNNCSGCHSPTNGFGDSQSIAIGVDNNGNVGRNRKGPRNQRRTPGVINTAFYPKLMWNGRFFAPSGNPFDNSQGYTFPLPEGTTTFLPHNPSINHLLIAQAHLPPTELNEAAGFTGTRGTLAPGFDQFDNGLGSPVPAVDEGGFRNEPIRQAVVARFNATPKYVSRFARLFPEVRSGQPITALQISQAVAEFEFTLTFADAPLDRFARGNRGAMTNTQKLGAILFFGKAGCVRCHAVSGQSNEMFSDFQNHVMGVPQIAPVFGAGKGNTFFDGPGADEDFGLEQVTGNPEDRYKFRTAPLRNLGVMPAFFHNGSFTRLEDAIRHHLDVVGSATRYDAAKAGVAQDLTHVLGPVQPVLDRLDPLVRTRIQLREDEIQNLVSVLQNGLLDSRARPESLCQLVPKTVPSGKPVLDFRLCRKLLKK